MQIQLPKCYLVKHHPDLLTCFLRTPLSSKGQLTMAFFLLFVARSHFGTWSLLHDAPKVYATLHRAALSDHLLHCCNPYHFRSLMGTSASVANGADAVKDIPQNHPKSSTIKPLGCSKISKKKQKTIFGLNPHWLLVYLILELHEVSLMNLARCSG